MGCLTTKASGEIVNFISPTVTPIESVRVYFSPTQLGEGTPSPDNVREIVGRTSVELTHTGTNLLGGEQLLENAKKHMPSMSDINTEEGWFKFHANTNINEQYTLSTNVRFKENTRYTFIITLLKSSGDSTNLRIYYTDGTYQHLTISVTGEKTTIQFVSKANKTVHYLRKFWGAAWTTIYYNECGVFEGVHSLNEFQHGVTSYQGETIPFSWKRLPDEYQEVEYIESDGTSYLDLNYIPIGNEKFELLFSYIATPSTSKTYLQLFGCREVGVLVSNKNCWLGIDSSNILYSRFGTVNIEDSILMSKGKHAIIVDLKNTCLSVDNNNYYFNDSIISDITMSIYLGYMHAPTSGTSLGTSGIGQYNNFIIYNNNNEVIHNFVPCYRKSDNEIGMFDTVSKQFFTNQGTGTFGKGNDIFSDEVYGGYVDLVKGEIVEEYLKYTIDNNNSNILYNGIINGIANFRISKNNLDIIPIGNMYVYFNNLEKTVDKEFAGWINANTKAILFYMPNTYNSLDKFKEFLVEHPIDVVYKINPIIHPLPDYLKTQLQTLKNENNIWSDGDSVEIDYDLAETFDIQKAKRKIIMNQPHVETLTGDAVSFTTDMKAPLKECKVYFEPVQEGSGDPSPDNVRNITGWEGVNVGLPSEYQEVKYIESKVESSSHPYINTGIIPNENMRIYLEGVTGSDVNGASFLFGSRTKPSSVTTGRFWGIKWGNRYCYGYINNSNTFIKSANINEEFIFDFNYNSEHNMMVNDSIEKPTNIVTDEYTLPIFLFGINNGGTLDTGQQHSFSVKRFIIYNNYNDIEPIMNLVPCYRKSDGEIGMYDTVSQTFYTNSGTGTFLKGEDVNTIIGNVSWADEVGTVYGGYVDLVKGELVVTNICEAFTSTTNKVKTYDAEDSIHFGVTPSYPFISVYSSGVIPSGNAVNTSPRNGMANQLKVIYMDNWRGTQYINTLCTSYSQNSFSIRMSKDLFNLSEEYTEIEKNTAINDYLSANPIVVYYELATPITYQLTPQQLITLKGQNNLRADTNGTTEIKFWKH